LDDTELAATHVTDDVPVARREIVKILILALRRIEELKDPIALDVHCLDVDELVVGPLDRIRMIGSVFRDQGAVAVTNLAEQDIPNQRGWEDPPVLPERSLW
jgi:hypothetical protein